MRKWGKIWIKFEQSLQKICGKFNNGKSLIREFLGKCEENLMNFQEEICGKFKKSPKGNLEKIWRN